jgi:hypothetical protein
MFVFCLVAQADVRHESVIEYKFSGTLGTVMKVLGLGKPVQTVDYYKGDIKRLDQLDNKGQVQTSEIIDLEQELLINIDHKKKRYTQITFEEWRQQIEEAIAQAEKMQAENGDEEYESEREYSYEIDMQVADEPEEIHGFEANKLTMTVEVLSKQKGSDEEPVKEMMIISEHWMTPELSGNDEIDAFNQKLMKKLGYDPEAGDMATMFEQLSQSNPELAEAMQKIQSEWDRLDGVPIKSVTKFEAAKPPEQNQEEEEEESSGGLFGGLKKKAAKKVLGGGEESGTVLELNSDILDHSTQSLEADLFTVPEKYKLKD